MVATVSCDIYLSAFVALAIVIAVQAQGRGNSHRSGITESCVLPSGTRGNCKLITQCPVVLENWSWQRPKICGRQGRVPIVCCPGGQTGPIPITDISPPTTNFECGKTIQIKQPNGASRSKRASANVNQIQIVGGVESFRNAWPWMALLGQGNAGNRFWFCSGVLLNRHWVLSAAHCTNRFNPTVVRLGEHDLNNNDDGDHVEDVGVAEVVYHPGYKVPEDYHDLVLIKLARPINLKNEKSPVCLPWGKEADRPIEGSTVTITGWGGKQFGDAVTPILNEANVTVFQTEVCAKSYSKYATIDYNTDYPKGLGEESHCIGDNSDEPSDSCQGDSGGPAVLLRNGRYTLVGIISNGVGCGKKAFPGIYVRVQYPEHLAWIKKVAFSNT